LSTPGPDTAAAADTAHPNALVESLSLGVIAIDERGAIDYMNPAAERLFGYGSESARGGAFAALFSEPDREEYTKTLQGFAGGQPVPDLGKPREVAGRHADGSTLTLELTLNAIAGIERRMLVAIVGDIGERKQAEASLRRQAELDPLTELINRRSFEQALARHVDHAVRYGDDGAVISMGLDNFKYLNDSLGSEGGDEVLKEVAATLNGRLRKTDVLARIGGDVFAMLVHGAGGAKGEQVAEELVALIRDHPFIAGRQGVRVTMSAGVTALEGRPVTGTQLLSEADAAMYAAKEGGRDRVVVFEAEGRDEAESKQLWSQRVREATERGLFLLVSQPVIDLETGAAAQHELLLRMRGEGGDVVQPAAFLATAERFGLIQGVDRWVTQQAVRLIAAANREGRSLVLEVNISDRTMGDANFAAEVGRELTSSGIDPASIIFEIKETATVADVEQARRFARALTQLGCRVALDDFGAGHASFYYLKHLPISLLKIDGEFIRELPRTPADQLIVKALVDVCKGMGIQTVAEFVGDDETVATLRQCGVDYGQGYHLGPPGPVSELSSS
jgi:diguanylate cyclase (GGDEF)-like protein/PAS domain S-box-containing protein